MRFIGWAVTNAQGPVQEGYVPLSDVTVIAGRNDSGKTRLLAEMAKLGTLAQDLSRYPGRPISVRTWDLSAEHTLYAECSGNELWMIVAGCLALGSEHEYPELVELREERLVVLCELLASFGLADDPPAVTDNSDFSMRELLGWGKHIGAEINDSEIDQVLTARPLVAIHPIAPASDTDHPELLCDVVLCVNKPEQGLRVDGARVRPAWAGVSGSPLPVLPLGRTSLPIIPGVVALPGAGRATSSDEYFSDLGEWAGAEVERASGLAREVEPDVIAASLQDAASALLPSFVAGAYELVVGDREDHRAGLMRIADGEHLEVTDVGAGYEVWIALAAEEAVRTLSEVCDELGWVRSFVEMLGSADHEIEAIEGARLAYANSLIALTAQLKSGKALAERAAVGPSVTFAQAAEVAQRFRVPVENMPIFFPLNRGRIYLIDEPERHLHPRLQRNVAKWLRETMVKRGSEAIVTTHSHPFLELREDCSLVSLIRPDATSPAATVPIAKTEVSFLDEFSREMGFDRGELLGGVNLLFFVEGPGDRAVLEALFDDRFEEAGIVPIAFGGVGNIAEIAHHVLVRGTSARIAVLVDNVDPSLARSLVANPEVARARLHDGTEVGALARLVVKAERTGRRIDLRSIGEKDILDVLDDDALRTIDERWPGHDEARAEYERTLSDVTGGEKPPTRAKFYVRKFGIRKDPETLRRAAEDMRRRGSEPATLIRLISELEAMATSH